MLQMMETIVVIQDNVFQHYGYFQMIQDYILDLVVKTGVIMDVIVILSY